MGKKVQIVLWGIIAIALFLLLGGCIYNLARAVHEDTIHPEVTFEIENLGTIKVELYQEYAPNTVANFIKLVEEGYYTDKVIFGKDEYSLHMGVTTDGNVEVPAASLVRKDIASDSESDFAYSIPGEFLANGYDQNTLRHEKGIITLIRESYAGLVQQSYDSGISQIGIIMQDSAPHLNGNYAAFGKVTQGLELLEKIYNTSEIVAPKVDETTGEAVETSIEEFTNKLVIKSAKVYRHGIDFGVPEIVEWFNYDEYLYQYFSTQYGS